MDVEVEVMVVEVVEVLVVLVVLVVPGLFNRLYIKKSGKLWKNVFGPFTQNYPNTRFPDDFVSRFRRFIAKSLGLHLSKVILVAWRPDSSKHYVFTDF